MLHQMLISAVAVAGLFGLWLGVQALARRQSGGDCDGADIGMCGCCAHDRASRCSAKLTKPDAE
jgi:hypothetical protein